MRKTLFFCIVVLSTISFVSCSKEKDSEKPIITLIAPEEDEPIKPGSDVHFDMELSDNEALKSYKVNVHYAGDGHSHAPIYNAGEETVSFEQTWLEADFVKAGEEAIEGKRNAHIHHHHIEIPTSVGGKKLTEGHYHFMVYCTDMAGNESFVAREIEISYSAEEHDHHHIH